MVTLTKSARWILLGVAILVLVGAGATGWIWYGNSRAWHNSKAAPLFAEIEPADGATVYASDVWIRWNSAGANKGRVLWRKAGGLRVQAAEAGSGQELLAHFGSLSAGSKYEYIVEESQGDQTLRSSVRTLTVISGLAFEPVVDQTVEHDYDQSVKLTLHNRGLQPVTVAAKALKQFDDLPSDITGYGSTDVPAQIAPNSTLDLRLAVTAADATRDTYEIPIEAAGAYITARFHVHLPKLSLSFRIIEENPKTLAKTVYIQNNGDTLTDLAVRVAPANQQDIELQPSVNHAGLHPDSGVYLRVTPILYLEFQSLKAEIEASAAGQTQRFPLEFQAPPGVRLIAFRSGSTGYSFAGARYCTNHPNTCSNVPGTYGNGPQTGVAQDPSSPEPGGCDPPKCNKSDACDKLKALLKLIKDDVDAVPYPLPPPEKYSLPLFSQFIAEFDRLFSQLANVDLACRFNKGNDPGVEEILQKIRRDRRSFQTLNQPLAWVPLHSDCVNLSQSARQKMACADYHAIEDIKNNLQGLSDANCPKQRESSGFGCPETKALEEIKTQAEWDTKLTKFLQEHSRQNDQELSKALEDTASGFEKLTNFLEKIIKGAEACEKIKKILDELRAIQTAINEIDSAGCDSQKEAQGFDDLARAAGQLAENLPALTKLDPELAGAVDMLAKDQNFFQSNSCKLNPECRWKKQFQGTDGYVPNCLSEVGPSPK